MRFLRGRKNKSAKYSVKEGEIKFEARSKKGDAKLCLMKIGLEESKEEISRTNSVSASLEEHLPGFTKKLIHVLKSNRFFYFIRYEKSSKSIIIPSKKDFTAYVLNCHNNPVFKAALFSVFHRQMRLRGFEVMEGLTSKAPGRLCDGIGYKASNNAAFLKAMKEK